MEPHIKLRSFSLPGSQGTKYVRPPLLTTIFLCSLRLRPRPGLGPGLCSQFWLRPGLGLETTRGPSYLFRDSFQCTRAVLETSSDKDMDKGPELRKQVNGASNIHAIIWRPSLFMLTLLVLNPGIFTHKASKVEVAVKRLSVVSNSEFSDKERGLMELSSCLCCTGASKE